MTTKPENTVDEPKTTAVVDMQQRLAQQLERQAEAAKAMRTSGSYISFKNAQMKVDGQAVPNNMADVRVLAAIGERTYYKDEFDGDTVQVPTCYALDDSRPHDMAAEPQADFCGECQHNKWGSAPKGRGKACREGARVIVVPANVPLKTAQMSTAKVPVSSLPTVTAFSSRCAAAGKLTGEFVTELSVVEDKKTFFKVHLKIKDVSTNIDPELLLSKQDEAYQLALEPYPVLEA